MIDLVDQVDALRFCVVQPALELLDLAEQTRPDLRRQRDLGTALLELRDRAAEDRLERRVGVVARGLGRGDGVLVCGAGS